MYLAPRVHLAPWKMDMKMKTNGHDRWRGLVHEPRNFKNRYYGGFSARNSDSRQRSNGNLARKSIPWVHSYSCTPNVAWSANVVDTGAPSIQNLVKIAVFRRFSTTRAIISIDQAQQHTRSGYRLECHLCRVAGNTVWSHMAREFQ